MLEQRTGQRLDPSARRRRLTLLVPVLVPVSMTAVFAALNRRLPARYAYNLGFSLYWLGWCAAFPIWVLGRWPSVRVLTAGRAATPGEAAIAAVPVIGAVATELWPNQRGVDPAVATVMVATAAANAVGEELLWRGIFLEQFPDDPVRGLVWPLLGFAAWHLAPQVVLPARIGRWRFMLAAGLVGSVSSALAARTGGLRATLLPHAAIDACGVGPARFRLGR